MTKHLKALHSGYTERIRHLETSLQSLSEEHEQFKASNDINVYFEKYLSLETKRKVLQEVEELSRKTEFVTYDITELNKCNEANVKGCLDQIVSDYNQYTKARI